jgi:uncharacterized protein
MKRRVVFDTTTVVSALVFRKGRLSWLRTHWREELCVPLISRATALELTKVLGYPKFKLSLEERLEFLAEYLPHCKIVEVNKRCPTICRDAKDQPFLDLAQSGKAEALVSGDRDLLVLAGRASFSIVTPEEYRVEFS